MNLYRFLSNDRTLGIYSYNAIKYHNGNKYATDGHIMVKIKEDYPATQEGKLLDEAGNEYIMSRSIDFDAVLPSDLDDWQFMPEFKKITLSSLAAIIKTKEITPGVAFIVIGGYAFRYSHFKLFLSVLKEYKSCVYHRKTHLYTCCDGMDCILQAAAPASAIDSKVTIDINQKIKVMEIETLQQMAKDCISVEIYRSKRDSTKPHTDYIEYLDATLQDLPVELPLHTYVEEMDAAEYNRTINANCGEVEDYEGKVLIIVLPRNYTYSKLIFDKFKGYK